MQVREDDQIMMISDAGTLVRTTVAEVSVLGRNTQGVRLIKVGSEEKLVELAAIDEEDAGAGDDELDAEDGVEAAAGDTAAGTSNGASTNDAGGSESANGDSAADDDSGAADEDEAGDEID